MQPGIRNETTSGRLAVTFDLSSPLEIKKKDRNKRVNRTRRPSLITRKRRKNKFPSKLFSTFFFVLVLVI
jgi:hypothetical protein